MPGFCFTLACAGFTVFLLGWAGYNPDPSGWVYGFLPVFWSLLMMLRLLTLTDFQSPDLRSGLAGRLLKLFHDRRTARQNILLQNALGGWFPALILVIFAYVLWGMLQSPIAQARLPADALSFLAARGLSPPVPVTAFFDVGRNFMTLLSLAMMGFVLRSYASFVPVIRLTQIILCGYAIAGTLFFLGIGDDFHRDGGAVFEKILLHNGAGAVAVCAAFVFIPLAALALSRPGARDPFIISCGFATGLALVVCFFIPFTPAIGAFAALCAVALFLAWGHADLERFDKRAFVG